MSKNKRINIYEQSPTLNTVLMVEETLMNMEKSIFSVADIKKKLPKQVNHQKLMIILDYLEKSNKIAVSIKGITWIHNASSKLDKEIQKGMEL